MERAWTTPEDRFGRNLRRLREAAGLSQQQLASRLENYGVKLHPSAIAKIELRDMDHPRAVRLNEAVALAQALDRSLAELTSGPGQVMAELAAKIEQSADEALRAREVAQATRAELEALYALDGETELPPELAALQARIDAAFSRIDGHDVRYDEVQHQMKTRVAGETMPMHQMDAFLNAWQEGADGEHPEEA